MTRTAPRRRVDAVFWQGRLRSASDFRIAAREALALAAPGQNCNPIAGQVILSAIAYADAITARKTQGRHVRAAFRRSDYRVDPQKVLRRYTG
jgi:hypothetical protein